MVVLGVLLASQPFPPEALWFVPLLFLVIRPLSVSPGSLGTPATRGQRVLIGWFGIRGIGSLYYLMYAITHGLPRALAERIAAAGAHHRGRVGRGPRHLGDAADAPLREAARKVRGPGVARATPLRRR